jgi:FkbM family methyltransferase
MDNHDLKNFELLSELIEKNDIVVDVGANNGIYTDFFKSKLGGTGKIYSFELSPKTFNRLKSKYTDDENIIVTNCAISNVDGELTYYLGLEDSLDNILGHDVSYRINQPAGKIKSNRLDTILKNEELIKLIKIDVEGAELFVLEGLKNIIDKVDNILVECHLSKDWEKIKETLIVEYDLDCINNSADFLSEEKKITQNSPISYQCFCRKKFKNG